MSNSLELNKIAQAFDLEEILLPENAESIIADYYNEKTSNDLALSTLVDGPMLQSDSFERKYSVGARVLGLAEFVDVDSKPVTMNLAAGKDIEFGGLSTYQEYSLIASDIHKLIKINNQLCTPAEVNQAKNFYLNKFTAFALRNMRAKSHFIWSGITTGTAEMLIGHTQNTLQIQTGVKILPDNTGTDLWTDYANSNPLNDLNDMSAGKNCSGRTPVMVLMNCNTYNHLVRSKSFVNQYGTPVGDVVDRAWGRSESLLGRHRIEVVEREGYIDYNGDFQEYLQDGIVVYVFDGDVTRIQPWELPNVERSERDGGDLGFEYGAVLTRDSSSQPRRDEFSYSDRFAFDFTDPEAFIVKKVY